MSDTDEESALDEKPSEFFTSIGNAGGDHDGQAIVPEGDHYKCWCSCGEWQIEAPTEENKRISMQTQYICLNPTF